MKQHEITIKFESNRELTQTEIDSLLTTIAVQVEEPAISDDEVGYVEAEWESSNIQIVIATL